jgi:ankyrin repeat protein
MKMVYLMYVHSQSYVSKIAYYIFKASRTLATLLLLPPAVLDQLNTQLELVQANSTERMTRRAKAAYQYAIGAFNRLRLTEAADTEIEKPLIMLCQAALFGNQQAQCFVNLLHESFGQAAPFSSEIEIPWLVTGTIHGSMAARKRLETLDPQEHRRAVNILRHEYAGLGIKIESIEEELDDYIDLHLAGIKHSYERLLHILAYRGRISDCRTMLKLGYYDVNETDAWGETALLVACRTGHAQIAELLIESAADPRIASNEKLTPLHFISAFDDVDIPHIGKRLFDCGAELEARSISGKAFNFRLDCQFGLVDGTPLLWAVAARNLTATRTLLELGADPFDAEGGNLPVSKSWGSTVHFSPVDFAARMHQYRFLEVMLGYCRKQAIKTCEWNLNNNFRFMAPYPEFAALPMFWAVNYTDLGLMERLLLHGRDYQIACKQTIQTLVDHGASTSEVDNRGQSALDIASSQGQLFLTAYLLQQESDLSGLQPQHLLELLFNTTRINDYASFNLLLDHAERVNQLNLDDDSMQHFYALTAERTNNISFIDFYLDSQRWSSISNRDDTEVFERAILKGHFDSARRIFEQGRVNIRKRLLQGEGDYSTTFGRLIIRAKKFKNAVDKVKFFLSLTGSIDDVFFKVARIHDMELTALHLACLYANYLPGLAASGPVMEAILENYSEARHLNARTLGDRSAGYTALHLAVEGGNLPAADRLLQTNINTNILNDEGETALDKVKMRWRNQARFMTDVPSEEKQAKQERHDKITERLTYLLERAGAICRKYFALVKKVDENTIFMEVFGGRAELVPLDSTSKSIFESHDVIRLNLRCL